MAGLDAALKAAAAFISDNVMLDTVRITLPATGSPVLNEDTGQLEYPQGVVLYEGLGAVLPYAGRSYSTPVDTSLPLVGETRSAYRLMTPLSAPIAPKDSVVTVVAVHDSSNAALLGRTWMCSDPGRAGTVEAVRVTALDQQQTVQPS